MGMTLFMPSISLKGSGIYLLARRCSKDLYAIPCSGAWNPSVQRLPWVRLVVAMAAGGPSQRDPRFYKCRISRMIGVM